MGFNPNDYEDVDSRIHRFYNDHPNGRILTFVQKMSEDWKLVLFRADVYRSLEEQEPSASGYASEVEGSSNVNRTSHIENCETSAIGRALANLGYSAKGQRASREEMEKASRSGTGQRASSPTPQAGRQAPSQPSKAKTSSEVPEAATPPSRDGDRPIPATAARTSPSSSEEVEAKAGVSGEVDSGTAEASSEGSTYELIARAMGDKKLAQRICNSANTLALKADCLPKGGVKRENIMDLPEEVLRAVAEKHELGATV